MSVATTPYPLVVLAVLVLSGAVQGAMDHPLYAVLLLAMVRCLNTACALETTRAAALVLQTALRGAAARQRLRRHAEARYTRMRDRTEETGRKLRELRDELHRSSARLCASLHASAPEEQEASLYLGARSGILRQEITEMAHRYRAYSEQTRRLLKLHKRV